VKPNQISSNPFHRCCLIKKEVKTGDVIQHVLTKDVFKIIGEIKKNTLSIVDGKFMFIPGNSFALESITGNVFYQHWSSMKFFHLYGRDKCIHFQSK